eukprot:9475769-Pyramimonas_sp.AAC.1
MLIPTADAVFLGIQLVVGVVVELAASEGVAGVGSTRCEAVRWRWNDLRNLSASDRARCRRAATSCLIWHRSTGRKVTPPCSEECK